MRVRLNSKHSSEITLTSNELDKAHKHFSQLFQNNHNISTTDQKESLQSFSSYLTNRISAQEKQKLIRPFTESELYSNLQNLVSKGPSSPGIDGISYQNWLQSWPFSKTILTLLANTILQGNIKENDSFAKVLIKLIPKKIIIYILNSQWTNSVP